MSVRTALAISCVVLSGCAPRFTPVDQLVALAAVSPPHIRYTESSVPDGNDRLTLELAIDRALTHNPGLQASLNRFRAADATWVQAHAWDNPSLSAELEEFGGDRNGLNQAELRLSAGLPIDFFRTRKARVDIAQADLQVARARYNDTRRDLSGRVRLAFHAVLAQQARIEIARARLEVTEKTAVAVSRQVRAGKAPPLEETRAQVVHQTLASEVRRAQSQLWMAGRELRALWGDDELGAFEGALRTEMPVLQQDSLAAELLSTHPLLHEYWWSAENHRHTERLLARQRWPQITPELGVRWLRSDHTRDFAAGVSVRLPLFDRKGGDLRGAKHQRQAALEDAQQVRLELLAALDVALRTLEEEHQRLSAYRTEIVPRAQESLRMARAGYEQGKFGYIDLLDAQRALIEIQREQTGALIAFDQALVRIEVLLGRDIE